MDGGRSESGHQKGNGGVNLVFTDANIQDPETEREKEDWRRKWETIVTIGPLFNDWKIKEAAAKAGWTTQPWWAQWESQWQQQENEWRDQAHHELHEMHKEFSRRMRKDGEGVLSFVRTGSLEAERQWRLQRAEGVVMKLGQLQHERRQRLIDRAYSLESAHRAHQAQIRQAAGSSAPGARTSTSGTTACP